jgi:carbamate kinase
MSHTHDTRAAGQTRPRAVVALGGNALLRRGEPLEAATQARAAHRAAAALAVAAYTHRLIVTHGNGPQVGLLALISDAYADTAPYPLDVLGSETEGQIGYMLELELANAIPDQATVTVLTRVVVASDDPAFTTPSKFIGPVYAERQARSLAAEHGWSIRPDGDRWRRVVASPQPRRIVQLEAIKRLSDAGDVVICAGGGGIPVVEDTAGRQRGVEAVIDKDLASSLLAAELDADALVLATDVPAVYAGYGTASERQIRQTTPDGLRALRFAPGSMGPKVEAVCRFVERTGARAAIGSLDDIDELLGGTAGTQVLADGPELRYRERRGDHVRAA